MTMLEDLREVVRLDRQPANEVALRQAIAFIRTHAEQIERDAMDAHLFRLLFHDDAGRELARKMLESAMHKEGE